MSTKHGIANVKASLGDLGSNFFKSKHPSKDCPSDKLTTGFLETSIMADGEFLLRLGEGVACNVTSPCSGRRGF